MVYKNRKFDLNEKPTVFCCDDGLNNKDNKFDDTALRLECFGHGKFSCDNTRDAKTKSVPDGGCGLVIGVGPASSFNESDLVLKLGLSDYSSASRSDVNSGSDYLDEGSTSAQSSGGYMPSLLLAPRISVPLKKLRLPEPESVHNGTGFRVARDGVKRTRRRGGLLVPHGITVQESKETDRGPPGTFTRLIHGEGPGSRDNHSLSSSSVVSNSTNWLGKPAKRRQMIPPQVLVPSSMKSSSILPYSKQSGSGSDNDGGRECLERAASEDRVHGGSLLSLLMRSNRGN